MSSQVKKRKQKNQDKEDEIQQKVLKNLKKTSEIIFVEQGAL
jgi:hypothetical protein